jgi:hypothetical protein
MEIGIKKWFSRKLDTAGELAERAVFVVQMTTETHEKLNSPAVSSLRENHFLMPISSDGFRIPGGIWSVVETCRQQGRGVWDYLTACVAVAAEGRIMPSLLTLPNNVHAA